MSKRRKHKLRVRSNLAIGPELHAWEVEALGPIVSRLLDGLNLDTLTEEHGEEEAIETSGSLRPSKHR